MCADVATAERVNDLLLPIVKGVGSERASEQLVQSLQTLGGSGYLQDYPIEQYVRDAKIDSLYEGTTAIQSLDFLFRKIVRDNGAALGVVAGEIQEFLDGRGGQRAAQGGARAAGHRARRRAGHAGRAHRPPDEDGAARRRPAHGAAADGGRRPARRLAAAAPGRGRARRARRRDRAATRPSTRARSPWPGSSPPPQLPLLTAHRTIVEHADNSLMDVPEAAF